MKTLFVAWKHKDPGGWHPVGRLDADVRSSLYRFRYVQGARAAQKIGFAPFDSFPILTEEYLSTELFPFFLNRVQNSNRPSFPEYLQQLDLASDPILGYDPIDVLAVSEGRRATDNLEVFPKIERLDGCPLVTKFFLHGLRYLSESSQEEALRLKPGQHLVVALEPGNRVTPWAIQFQTEAKVMLGYAPRYLLPDLQKLIFDCMVSAQVARINPPPAPPNQRILVRFEGCWPDGYEPMSGEEFQPLVQSHSQFVESGVPLAL